MRQTQSLREDDINLILTEIAKSDNILLYSKNELITLLDRRRVFLFYDVQKLIGLSAYKEINKDWVELALLLVVSQYRNQGYGTRIYKDLLQYLREKIYIVVHGIPLFRIGFKMTALKRCHSISYQKRSLYIYLRQKLDSIS